MDSDDKFWLIVGFCILGVVGIIASAITFNNMQDNILLESMVNRGHSSPIEAKCAMLSSEQMSKNSACLMITVRKALEQQAKLLDPDGTKTY